MKFKEAARAGGIVSSVLATVAFASIMAFGVTSEVPIGNVTGTVTMKSSNKPLPKAEVVLIPVHQTLDDEVEGNYSTRTDASGNYKLRGLPVGLYMVDAYGKAHHNEKRLYVRVTEGKTEVMDVPTDRSSNGITLYANQRVFLPDEKPNFTLSGYTEQTTMQFQVYSVSLDQMMEKKDPSTIVNALAGDRTSWNPEKTPGIRTVRDDKLTLTLKDVEGHFTESVSLQALPVGQYLVRANAGPDTTFTWLTVSSIALVTKAHGGHALAFVTDLKTGRPIPGASMSVAAKGGKRPVGRTDSQGILEFALPPGEDSTKFVLAESESSKAYTWFYGSEEEPGKSVLWAQTDRPLYRPGDVVKYKVVARDLQKAGYTVSKGELSVEVLDPDQEPVSSVKKTLSDDGTVWGEFKTDPDALPGSYEMRLGLGDASDVVYVPIMTYRKPEFRVDVKPLKSVHLRGEKAKFAVHVETYTGEPAPGMSVRGQVYSLPDWSYDPFDEGDPGVDEGYEADYYGDFLDEIAGKTDENGDCTIEVDTAQKSDQDQQLYDAKITVIATVGDQGGRTAEGRGTIRVIRGLFDLQVSVDRYVSEPGKAVTFHIQAVDQETKKPVPGITVELERGHERWNGRKSTFVVDERKQVVLDADGRADFTAASDAVGLVQATASATDARGNKVSGQASVWYDDYRGDYEGPTPSLQIILDKKSYGPKEVAKALILTSHPGGSALLTIEADGVLKKQIVELKAKSNAVELDGLSSLAPNAVVGVSYVFDKSYYTSEKQISVDLTEKRLNVTVTPSTTTTAPGGSVAYTVRTAALDGTPVSTDLALGVVDESLYAIQEDRNDPIRTFYPRRWSTVQTAYSFPTIYLDGEDKTPKSVRVRRNFEDTAGWFPNVHTDSSGVARVELKMPDNLTEWRATVTAVSSDTRIGKATSKVVSKRDLMVRLGIPAFFVEGDKQEVSARVSNTTDRELKLKVSFVGTGVSTSGPANQDLTVKAGGTEILSWTVTAMKVGDAKFKVAAWDPSGTASDGVEQSVPVILHGQTLTKSLVGVTNSSRDLEFAVDPQAASNDLTVTLSTTLLGSLLESLPGLVDYPYGCTEQTMSRFLPAVLVSGLMKAAAIHDPEIEARIPEVAKRSLKRLRVLQTSAGGWGWWEYDQPDPQLTAYVLEGLWRMKPLGVAADEKMVGRALDWAEKQFKVIPNFRDDFMDLRSAWVQLACSVSLYRSSPDVDKFLASIGSVKKLNTQSLSLIVVSTKARGQSTLLSTRAYQEIMARMEETPDTAHWQEFYGYESTGAAWEAVVTMDPASPLSEKIARYLFAVRKRGQTWASTRDTARILVSATKYLQQTKELSTELSVDVIVNGKSVKTVALTGTSVAKIRVPGAFIAGQKGTVRLQTSKPGKLFYSCESSQAVRQQTFVATDANDFSIRREFYSLSSERLQDGSLRRMASRNPVHQAKTGEVLALRVTLVPKTFVSQFICEIPIPSNMRIVDEEEPLDGMTWQWWWSRSVFTERKAVLFGSLSAGKPQVVDIAVRAEAPGSCEALPAFMYRMYQPDQRASTEGYDMDVRAK